ncbi:hypothetical protein VP1G_06841 [Cytospora mali]|uniref:C3H1-type domain-containing protein n=1 Tax=Cytospora mali TaxID=578113 RepID=A0A194V6N6_CYTMA|nr:hypothetical protein VP1G_06841 [Valsa mali var. pyri (nom. inval.)]
MESSPDSNLVDLHPFPNSPSDLGCSSGLPSSGSTRETSPASSTHHPLGTSAPGSASFQEPPDQISSVTQKALEMDRDSFQTVNGRRSKLTGDPPRASHASSGITASAASNFGLLQQTTGRPLAPNPHLHSSTPFSPPTIVPQGHYCRDWRTSTASLDNLGFPSSTTSPAGASSSSASCSTNTNRNFATASGGSILSSPVSPVGFGNNLSNRNSLLSSNGYLSIANLADSPYSAVHDPHNLNENGQRDASTRNIANMHPTNGLLIAEADMDTAMGYCFDRGGGQYTRLVAVDLLPIDLNDIPRRVASDEGLIVLPVPRMPGPNGQPADSQLEPQAAVTPPPSSPSDHPSTDLVQTRIDSIVASSPHGTASPNSGAVVLATRGRGDSSASAVASRANNANKREKIYCDKWIHDGTCAFTQQGCKFKHEMPNDKETQEKLGLFHGYPSWWKKLLAEQQRPTSIDDRPVSIGAGRGGGGGGGGAGGAGPGAMVGPAYTNAWRPAQNGQGHTGEAVEDARPASFGAGSGAGGRGGGGFGTRGGSRQGRGGAAVLNAPNYGPIGPPSRVARSSGRGSRGPTGPPGINNGFGALPARIRCSNTSEANLYAALMDQQQGRDDDTGDTGEDEEQRGAKL